MNVRIFPNGELRRCCFKGQMSLKEQRRWEARTGGTFARNTAGTKPKKVPERSWKGLKRMVGGAAGRPGEY